MSFKSLAEYTLLSLLFICAAIDVLTYKIPNFYVVLVFLCSIWRQVNSNGTAGLLSGTAAAFVILFVGFFMHQAALFGAGDIKLLAAASAYFDDGERLVWLLCVFGAATVIGIGVLAGRRRRIAAEYAGKQAKNQLAFAVPVFLGSAAKIGGIL